MEKPDFSNLSATFVNCTLKKSPEKSHTATLMKVSENIMEKEGVEIDKIRLIDHEVPYGVFPDMTEHGWDKDEWPALFERIINADILVLGSPIWLGQPGAVTKNFIDRLYGMSGKTNEDGQYIFYGKTGGCIITGNEDGIKHCSMNILYSLQHVGYTIPPQADSGWIGEAGPGPSYGDTAEPGATPTGFDSAFTNKNVTFMSYNLLHMAKILKENGGLPDYGNSNPRWEDGERWQFEHPEDLF